MPVLDTLKQYLGNEDRVYDYECTNCEAEFESPYADMSKVSCPECAASRVRSATPAME
jgi:DNA-directed RNA polymerase subunit RPC12/RpoP